MFELLRQFRFRPAPGGLLLPLLLTVAVSPVQAFEITGSKWSGGEAELYVSLNGFSQSGGSWNAAYIDAANDWSEATDFNFLIIDQFADPCLDDGRNGVDFTSDVCGTPFGERVLAVTLRKFNSSILGPARLSETDIVINEEVSYDVYDGPLVRFGFLPRDTVDFRRVALHELGHAIGLDHESSVAAIMAPNIGDIHRLREDDIAGVNTLYGGLSNCTVKPLKFGITADSLAEGDCRVNELTAGGDDDSFIDVYQFSLNDTTELEITMTSATLDSVLLVADASLKILSFDSFSSDQCDSTLSTTLAAGSYFLLANTFDKVAKPDCGIQGDYELTVAFTAPDLISLGPNNSLLGDVSGAVFTAGISADNGTTFGNVFTSTDSLDIVANMVIDPAHSGLPGFLVVAAFIGDEILLLNQQGQFVAFDPQAPLERAREKTLDATETITIVDDLVPAEIGIDAIVVDIVVGYGLAADPEEVFFHQAPLSLIVTPE